MCYNFPVEVTSVTHILSVFRSTILLIALPILFVTVSGCQATGSVRGNEGGSEPLNEQESLDYQKAVSRCLKTGGSRIVKVKGELRCY